MCGPHFPFLSRAQEGGLWASGGVFLDPAHWTRSRCREPARVGVVVCADGKIHTSADYKTGKNAVILSRC